MGENTGIEWATHSWNPWQGCHKVSTGCKNCYMYREKRRYGQDPTTVVRSSVATFRKPLSWRDPARVFACSWSDWFIEDADPWRDEAWDIVRRTPHLTYQILTKRPENMPDRLPLDWGGGWDNVWLGVSAEDQRAANERVPLLLRTPAAVRFVSCEPLLGLINLTDIQVEPGVSCDSLKVDSEFLGVHRRHLNWVIAGGESGPSARPCHPDWVRRLRDQCQASGVPFFWKQWGAWKPLSEEEDRKMNWTFDRADRFLWVHPDTRWRPSGGPYAGWQPFYRVGKKAAGRLLDGREWSEFPDAP